MPEANELAALPQEMAVEARDHSHWYGVRVAVVTAGPDDSGLCAGLFIFD